MQFLNAPVNTVIPTKIVGPISLIYCGNRESVNVPMATLETPLWNSTKRGALVSQESGGIHTVIASDSMTRSIVFDAGNAESAQKCAEYIMAQKSAIADVISKLSKYAKLLDIHIETVAKLIYVRFSIESGNASGHNMATLVADNVADFIMQHCHDAMNDVALKYLSVSGNYCTDKKVSSVNGILGRGKKVSAEITIPRKVCRSILKTTPEKICELNVKKNLIGSILAGSIRSANAHYANIVLSIFLATGQDAANIIEASQGITFAEILDDALYFSVTLPNIIVGTVGNGKNSDYAVANLALMGCSADNPDSARRLAAIIAAATLCSELSLMAALTNQGELMKAHISLERRQ